MTIAIERHTLGPIGTNTFVIRASEEAREAVVVDPAGEAESIVGRLDELGARCVAILVTHGHFDHILGVADLAGATGAPVSISRIDAPRLSDPQPAGPFPAPSAYTPDALLEGGERLAFADMDFDVVFVPGHSPGHVAFYTPGVLFSGDVLFAGSVGRTDLDGGDWPTLLESIRTLTEQYPAETLVCNGHGPETTLGQEIASNPFLVSLRS